MKDTVRAASMDWTGIVHGKSEKLGSRQGAADMGDRDDTEETWVNAMKNRSG